MAADYEIPGLPVGASIAQMWEAFERLVMSQDAGAIQRRESRLVFYSAVHQALVSMGDAAEALPEDKALAYAEGLLNECHGFAAAVAAGKA